MSDLAELVRAFQAGAPGSVDVLFDYLLEAGLPDDAVRTFLQDVALGITASMEEQASTYSSSSNVRSSSTGPFLVTPSGQSLYAENVRPWTFFYEQALLQTRVETQLFRDLNLSYVRTNFTSPQRIPTFNAFKLKRISIMFAGWIPTGTFKMRINRTKLCEVLVDDLAQRGVWGLPVHAEISDSDDLNAAIEHPLNLANARVCVLLHGILRTPLRR